MKSFCDYLGLSNSCSYDVDDVIGRADRFGFQNFCSPGRNNRLVMLYKIQRGLVDMDARLYQPTATSRVYSSSYPRTNQDWNSMPASVTDAVQ